MSMSNHRRIKSPTFNQWLLGARPRTWANAFAPVIVGTGAAYGGGNADLGKAVIAAIVSLALIVGVNYANDYSDGIRGTDDDRTGPLRLVGSGVARPQQVKNAAFIAFGVAGIAGFGLALATSWWLVGVGVICILAAWFYTGGKHPYGYRGFGEAAVFIFFGLVAVLGTQFTQLGFLTYGGIICAVAVGAMSASVNLINNLRDIPTDTAAGKITLAVLLGDHSSRILYFILLGVALAASLSLALSGIYPLGLLAAPFMWVAAKPVWRHAVGAELIPVLSTTGQAMLIWSVLSAASFAIS